MFFTKIAMKKSCEQNDFRVVIHEVFSIPNATRTKNIGMIELN